MAALKFPVGRQRIDSFVSPSEAGYTRAIRTQMKQVIANAKKVVDTIEFVSEEALIFALQPIYEKSQELVPVDTGKLKRSGFVSAKRFRGKIQGIVGYAKAGNPSYAALVHERMEFRHASPTQAKFLEEAVNQHTADIVPRYVKYVKDNVGLG